MKIITNYYPALLVSILILIINSTAFSQENKAIKELDAYIAKAVVDFEVPGMAIGIIKNGGIVYLKGFGESNTVTKTLVDEETIFGIASCSKAFTAACIAILVDEGKLNWDDNVTKYLPDFKLYDEYITNDLMIEDLLCHRSGLGTFDGDLLWYGSSYTRKEVVERIQFRENPHKLRASFGYSNLMFIVAGEVIERVTGQTWDEFVEERIFSPLKMESSNTSNSLLNDDMNIAYPHIEAKPLEFINYDNCGPAASINTSANDLLKWTELMLNKGVYKDDTIFSQRQYYQLISPHTLTRTGRGETIGGTHFSAYGLGWFLSDYRGRKIIQHGGGLPGFHSKVAFVPEDSLGVVIIANQLSGLVEAVYKKVLDFYLSDPNKPDENRDWAALYLEGTNQNKEKEAADKKEKEESRKKETQPSLALNNYTGEFEDKMYGKAQINSDNEQLSLVLLPTKELFTGKLEHWENDTFRFKFNDPFLPEGFLTFEMDDSDGVSGFTIDLENPDFHFYKLKFFKLID
jgi:CubicO group peptidase (beta-lactamase class C family)